MMGGPAEMWLAIGLAAIVLPAIVFGLYLHRSVQRAMYGHEILDVLDQIADETRSGKPVPSAKPSRGKL